MSVGLMFAAEETKWVLFCIVILGGTKTDCSSCGAAIGMLELNGGAFSGNSHVVVVD